MSRDRLVAVSSAGFPTEALLLYNCWQTSETSPAHESGREREQRSARRRVLLTDTNVAMPDFDWFNKKREPPAGELPAEEEKAAEPPSPAPRRRRRSSAQSGQGRLEDETSPGNGTVGVVQETLKDMVGSKLRESGDDPDEMWRLMAEMGSLKNSVRKGTLRPLPKGRAVEAVNMLEELFHYMTSSAILGGNVCPAVRVPLTLVFRLTRPHIWYQCRKEVGSGIRETNVTESMDEILERFRLGAHEVNSGSCDILAIYVYNKPVPSTGVRDGQPLFGIVTCIEYFDLPLLEDFLRNRRREHDGILQQFSAPTGGRSSMLRASVRGSVRATDDLRVELESRMSLHTLSDKRRPVRDRAVTFDGAEHESRLHALSPNSPVTEHVTSQTAEILKHIAASRPASPPLPPWAPLPPSPHP